MSLLASVGWAETVTVSMKDRAFTPEQVIVKVGDTVRWVNDDTEVHQVISGKTPFDPYLGYPMNSGVLLWNTAYAFTFTTPGSYRYMCVIHRALVEHVGTQGMVGLGMVGEVVVTGSE